jgi:hypothetical protein
VADAIAYSDAHFKQIQAAAIGVLGEKLLPF